MACCRLLRPIIGVSRCCLGQRRPVRRRSRSSSRVDEVQGLADLQHGGGVGDVLRGGAPVARTRRAVAAELVDLGDHAEDRVADALGLLAQLGQVDLVEVAVADDLLGGLGRDQPELALHLGQRGFDVEVLLRCGSRRTRRGASRRVAKMPWKMAESMMVDGMAVLRSERGSVARAGQGAGGLQDHRAVDHSAVEPGGSRRGAVGGQHPVRPGEGLGVRGQRGVDRLDLAPGGCTAWRRSRGGATTPGRPAAGPRSSSWGVTPATGAGSPAMRDATASRPAA